MDVKRPSICTNTLARRVSAGPHSDRSARGRHLRIGAANAFVAVIATLEGERQIGVARYVMLDDGATCEFAVVVSDDWHGKGVARHLVRSLIDAGRARGLRTMVGITLPEKERVKNLARQAGFAIAPDPDDWRLVRMTLPLELRPSSPPPNP